MVPKMQTSVGIPCASSQRDLRPPDFLAEEISAVCLYLLISEEKGQIDGGRLSVWNPITAPPRVESPSVHPLYGRSRRDALGMSVSPPKKTQSMQQLDNSSDGTVDTQNTPL